MRTARFVVRGGAGGSVGYGPMGYLVPEWGFPEGVIVPVGHSGPGGVALGV